MRRITRNQSRQASNRKSCMSSRRTEQQIRRAARKNQPAWDTLLTPVELSKKIGRN